MNGKVSAYILVQPVQATHVLYADKHATMLNMTARLAVEIKVLPDWDVDWSDTAPQRDPASLRISDILPTNDDGIMLRKKATQHIMQVLVDDFPSLADLKQLLPTPVRVSGTRSNVVPMKILFQDEKYKSETIDILTRLVKDAELSGKPEVYH